MPRVTSAPGDLAEPLVDEMTHALRADDEDPEPDDRVDSADYQERHALVVDEPD